MKPKEIWGALALLAAAGAASASAPNVPCVLEKAGTPEAFCSFDASIVPAVPNVQNEDLLNIRAQVPGYPRAYTTPALPLAQKGPTALRTPGARPGEKIPASVGRVGADEQLRVPFVLVTK